MPQSTAIALATRINDMVDPDEVQRLRDRVSTLEEALATQALETQISDLQLVRADQVMQQLFQLMPALFMVIDAQGRIRQANQEAARLLGRPQAALIGCDVHWLIDAVADPLQQHLTDPLREPSQFEAYLQPEDAPPIPLFVCLRGLQTEQDERHSALLIALDLRARRDLEASLRHAQKMEAVGQMTAGIAHEINTPLQYVVDHLGFLREGMTQLVRLVHVADPLVPPVQETAWRVEKAAADFDFFSARLPRALERIQEGVDRVNGIVKGMRVFAHPGAHHVMSDLNALIDSSLLMASGVTRHHLDVTRDLQPIPLVPCIPGDIAQVVINLVTNAAHAVQSQGRSGRGRLVISTRHIEEDHAVALIVSDDGPGVPAKFQHRLFDPFFTTKPVGEGTGQGLSISQNIIVVRHQGRIWYEPSDLGGACFQVRLPLA